MQGYGSLPLLIVLVKSYYLAKAASSTSEGVPESFPVLTSIAQDEYHTDSHELRLKIWFISDTDANYIAIKWLGAIFFTIHSNLIVAYYVFLSILYGNN